MKKTKSLRVASGMLALTLITSCFVGGTFAKYTTKGAANDTARVAKFGVTVTGAGSTFQNEYVKTDQTYEPTDDDALTVKANVHVVAPGTDGQFAAVNLEGTPEVAVRIAYNVTTLTLDNWNYTPEGETDAKDYCPIIFTVGDDTLYINQNNDDETVATFANRVKTAINAYHADYAPGTDLSKIGTAGYPAAPSISWKWEFEGVGGTLDGYQTDEKDTALGDKAAENDTLAGKITLEASVTVTQID